MIKKITWWNTEQTEERLSSEPHGLQWDDRNVEENKTKETQRSSVTITPNDSFFFIRIIIIAANCPDNSPSAELGRWKPPDWRVCCVHLASFKATVKWKLSVVSPVKWSPFRNIRSYSKHLNCMWPWAGSSLSLFDRHRDQSWWGAAGPTL